MLRFICLSVFVAGAFAIVCEPDICATVRCAQVTDESCNGVVKQNGGFCGCCDACVVELAEGDTCFSGLLGVPSESECAEGLYCSENNVCEQIPMIEERELGPCAEELAEVNAQLASEEPLLGLEKPNCDENGLYAGMQVSGSQAYCVTVNGTMIDGYMVNRWETGDDMNCKCARDQYDYMQTGLIGKLFYCEPNGNYRPGDME